MVPAVIVIVILSIGLPLAAWLLSHHLDIRRPPPADGLGPPVGGADRWLMERYRLPAVRRYQVRQAVLYGRALRDPELRNAARDLAAAALDGEITIGRGARLVIWILLAEALVLFAAGMFVVVRMRSPAGAVPVLLGTWMAVKGVAGLRMAGSGAERARRLNAQADFGDPRPS